jgi:hypothetical protein
LLHLHTSHQPTVAIAFSGPTEPSVRTASYPLVTRIVQLYTGPVAQEDFSVKGSEIRVLCQAMLSTCTHYAYPSSAASGRTYSNRESVPFLQLVGVRTEQPIYWSMEDGSIPTKVSSCALCQGTAMRATTLGVMTGSNFHVTIGRAGVVMLGILVVIVPQPPVRCVFGNSAAHDRTPDPPWEPATSWHGE